MNDKEKPTVNYTFTVEKFDDEILLYTKAGGQAIYLNDTMHAVWTLCKEDMTIGQIIAYLQQLYPEQKEQIRTDVTTALKALASHNVIKLTDAN